MNKQQFDEAIDLLRKTQQALTSSEMYPKLNRETLGLLRDIDGYLSNPNQLNMLSMMEQNELEV